VNHPSIHSRSARHRTGPAIGIRRDGRHLGLCPLLAVALLLSLGIALRSDVARAEAGADEHAAAMKSLDEQVQEIKSEVLAIGAELSNLEERLLYPSNSQVAVFVSIGEGETLELDSIRLSIDGELVTQYVYSWKELEALRRGGVQRLHTGNVTTGEHRLEVVVASGSGRNERKESSHSFVFEKRVEPALVGIELGGRAAGDASISLGSW